MFAVIDLLGMPRKPQLSSRKRHSSFAKVDHSTPSTVDPELPEDDELHVHSTATQTDPGLELCTVGVQTDSIGEIVQATENLLTPVAHSLFVSVLPHYFFQSSLHLSQLLSSMKCRYGFHLEQNSFKERNVKIYFHSFA